MAHEHDGPVELVDDRSEICHVARDPAKGKRRSDKVVRVAVELLEHRAPARGVSESTVNENDCRLGHEAAFRLGKSPPKPAPIVPGSRPWFALVRCPCLRPVLLPDAMFLSGRHHWVAPNPLEDQWSFFAKRCVPNTTGAAR